MYCSLTSSCTLGTEQQNSPIETLVIRPLRHFRCFYFLCFLIHTSEWTMLVIQLHFGGNKPLQFGLYNQMHHSYDIQ